MTQHVLFGTYTNGDSKGIYQADLNEQTAQLSNLTLVAETGSPTYFALSQANHLYAIDRRDGEGGLSAWDNSTRPAQHLSERISEGSSPAYIGFDETRQLVYAAYYHRGTVESLKVNGDDMMLADTWRNEGSGPKPEQESAHPHFANLTPDNKLVVADLGTDEVIVLDVDNDGKMTELSRYQSKMGTGARHIRFHKNGQFAYLLGELGGTVEVLKYQDGHFEHIQMLDTVPAGQSEGNGAAAIRISNDSRFLYASNRGHDSIAVFEINTAGDHIELIQQVATEGAFPRDFNWTADNHILVVANQKTNNASTFERDEQTGKLTLIQKDFAVPESVRVLVTN